MNKNLGVELKEVATDSQSDFMNINHSDDKSLMHKSYHELSDTPVQDLDEIANLKQNIAMLENIQERFSFMMKEVRYLMKV